MADYKIGNKSYTGVNKVTTKSTSGAAVDLVSPSGTVNLYSNGTFDVSKYAQAKVEVEDSGVPEGYIKPEGSKTITSNGTHDVTNYVSAVVNVEGGGDGGYPEPTGTKTITSNGTHDVKDFASASVNVPIPSGYIDDTGMIVSCKKTASGSFDGTGNLINTLSLSCSFRPKIILIWANSQGTNSSTGSPYSICSIMRVYDDNFNSLQSSCNFFFTDSSTGKGRIGNTASSGISSNSSNQITGWGSNVRFHNGTTYNWIAWG